MGGRLMAAGRRRKGPMSGLSEEASALLAALPTDGSPVSNRRLRELTKLDTDVYTGAVDELKIQGLVGSGRGRGGTLARTDDGAPQLSGPAPTTASPPLSPGRGPAPRKKTNGAEPLGFEDTLWKAADKLRGSMDASEYKHVVLGLVFLKYIDDAFAERRAQLATDLGADGIVGEAAEELLESRDEYTAEGVFWVPPEARWGYLQANAKQAEIGKLIDGAMDAVEVENPSLRGVLPKNFARPGLDVRRLGELVDLIAGLGLGAAEHREKDLLGRVYEYFLGRFASAEGKGGGEFYTPRSVVKLLVEMIEPYRGQGADAAAAGVLDLDPGRRQLATVP